jgi:transposase
MVERPPLTEETWATLAPEVVAYIAALEAAVQTLTARVAELDARLRQNSSNSSRPPSSDAPRARSVPPPAPDRRRPGGQPGHRGTFRVLVPAAQVTHIACHLPPVCDQCGTALAPAAGADDPPDHRHQVVEVLPVSVEVTEHRLAARTCGACGHRTRAPWPVGVPRGVLGPRLAAQAALLTGRYRLSKRETATCLADLFGVAVSIGTISAVEQQVSQALEPVVAQARAAVAAAPVVNMDETGWRQGRQRAWLWTVVTALVTVFHIDPSRGSAVVRTLLGPDWCGIVGSDRFSAYRWLGVDGRQVCWAHLRRDFQKLVDWGPGPRPLGLRLLACHTQVFELWHRHRSEQLDRTALVIALSRVGAEMHAVLETGRTSGHPVAQSLCRELLAVWPALWAFAVVEGVEPTNNRAEQALRPAVLWRKGSFGTHSAAGSRFVERMLTVSATCRQQDRRVADFLFTALTAAQTGQPHPSLLPATT